MRWTVREVPGNVNVPPRCDDAIAVFMRFSFSIDDSGKHRIEVTKVKK
jgi:hypothetical protein